MSTRLLDLPQFLAGTIIAINSNVDWNDQFFVPVPGFPAGPITLTGALASNATFTVVSSGAVLPGMLAQGYGLPLGDKVQTVGSTTITLTDDALITAPGANVTFFPPPLDLTGITFSSTLRVGPTVTETMLAMSTANGLMTNGGAGGQFGWCVSAATLLSAPWPAQLVSQGQLTCVLDVIASDATGAKVNLCAANGPITVNVTLSVTR